MVRVTRRMRESPEYRRRIQAAAYNKVKRAYNKCAAAYDAATQAKFPRPCSNTIRKKLRMPKLPLAGSPSSSPSPASSAPRSRSRTRSARSGRSASGSVSLARSPGSPLQRQRLPVRRGSRIRNAPQRL